MDDLPKVLILGHSFVRRFQDYIKTTEDQRVAEDMNLSCICYVQTYGIGGRTVRKLRMFDLGVVQRISFWGSVRTTWRKHHPDLLPRRSRLCAMISIVAMECAK